MTDVLLEPVQFKGYRNSKADNSALLNLIMEKTIIYYVNKVNLLLGCPKDKIFKEKLV